MPPDVERAALCEVTNAAREKLEAICIALDQQITADTIVAKINEKSR